MSKVKELDKKYIANTYGRQNIVFKSGKGSYLFDEDGKKYIDFGSGIAVNGLGVANNKWLKTIIKQAKLLPHVSNLYYSEPQTELAQMLVERTGMNKVFFSNSGAEANECAIKCARKYSFDKYGADRYRIVTLKNSFHGRTMATLTATGQDAMHKYFDPFLEGFDYVSANDYDELFAAVTDKTCAVLLELVQGEGGVNALDKEYVKKTAELCAEKDVLLLIDEVQTGNGRTGTLYAFMQYGIIPDVFSTAKGLGNGLPLGATVFGKKTENTLSAGLHGSTFGGNPIACKGACEVLKALDYNLLSAVLKKSELIFDALKSMKKVKSVSGLGLMIGIETDDAATVKDECLKKGLVVLTAKNKVRLLPALNIGDKVLKKGLEILSEVLG